MWKEGKGWGAQGSDEYWEGGGGGGDRGQTDERGRSLLEACRHCVERREGVQGSD